MDASFVYGSSQRLADTLREGIGGRLRVEFRDGRPWPPAAANKSAVCDQQTDEEPCYQFGQYLFVIHKNVGTYNKEGLGIRLLDMCL